MVKYLRYVSVFIFAAVGFLYAQNISISATTDTTDYKVGDYIKYTVDLKYDKGIKVDFPSVKDSVNNLDFIQEAKPKISESNGKVFEKHTFIFSKYDSAQVTIPSYRIYYSNGSGGVKKYLAVNPVTIVVKTLQVNQKEDIRDVKDPVKLPLNWLFIGIIALVVIVLLIVGYYMYRQYKKRKEAQITPVPVIVIPPDEIALNELRDLEEKKLWQQGMIKEYHSEITGIVRKYFEGRFDFRALELTSAEIMGCLNYLDDAKNIISISENFFSNADLVKFAKFQPMPKVNEEMMEQAYQIVRETKSKPIPKPVENVEAANVK